MPKDPFDEKSQFDHHFRPEGEARIVTIYHNSRSNKRLAFRENFELSGITIFRFKQDTPFQPFQLNQGDVIEEENRNRWQVVECQSYWNTLMGMPIVPISFDVTTRPLSNNETMEEEETQVPEPGEPVPPPSPTTQSAPITQPQPQPETLPEITQTPQTMTEEPPDNREPSIIERGIRFAIDHPKETIVILALVFGVSVVGLFWKDLITQIPRRTPTSEQINNPQKESKLKVTIRLKWRDGLAMNGGYVTLLSHGGPKELGRSNDQGYIYSVELPKEDGIKFEVSHPIELKIAQGRELNLKSNPKPPIEWFFPKDSDSSPSGTITPQQSSNSNLIKVNMVCFWKHPVNEVIRGAGFSGFDTNSEPISNIKPTNERGYTSFFIAKDRFPLSLTISHTDARDPQAMTISLQESELNDKNILPFNDCRFNRKEK